MINRNRYAGDKVLRHTDFKNGQVVTILAFVEIRSTLRGREVQAGLRLEGFDPLLPLNTTNLDYLLDKLGEDEQKWRYKKVKINLVDVEDPDGNPAIGVRLSLVEGKSTAA